MSEQVIRDGALVEDTWVLVDDGELPGGDVIVPAARWLAERDALRARAGRVGVLIAGDDDPADLAADLDDLPVIALAFPKFADGRCYSHARVLREHLGYAGELRAVGEVLRDQAFYMRRCGINTFVLRDDQDAEDFVKGLGDFSVTYQPAADHDQPLWRRVQR